MKTTNEVTVFKSTMNETAGEKVYRNDKERKSNLRSRLGGNNSNDTAIVLNQIDVGDGYPFTNLLSSLHHTITEKFRDDLFDNNYFYRA